MKVQKTINLILIFTLLALTIGCDQISKSIVRQQVEYNQQISLIHSYFKLTKIENEGAFLSIGDSLPPALKFFLLSILPSLALAYGLYFLFTKNSLSRNTLFALCFTIGGGIGNMYDRLLHGSVTDFLHIDLGHVQTGIFNLADVSITTGMILFLIELATKKKEGDLSSGSLFDRLK